MHDRSIAVSKFSAGEISAMRTLGRRHRDFKNLTREATRLGLYGAAFVGRLDADASAGMGRLHSDALLALARMPARNAMEFRTKSALFRAWLDGGADDTNMRVLLDAALAADASRLGVRLARRELDR